MRLVDLGGGAVAFENEGRADQVASLDPQALRALGLSAQAVDSYLRYRHGSPAFGGQASESPAAAPVGGAASAAKSD
jgi:hypothetical protein